MIHHSAPQGLTASSRRRRVGLATIAIEGFGSRGAHSDIENVGLLKATVSVSLTAGAGWRWIAGLPYANGESTARVPLVQGLREVPPPAQLEINFSDSASRDWLFSPQPCKP